MTVQKVLLLGHPKLYQVCDPVRRQELQSLEPVIQDLHDTLFDFRRKYGVGRAIAAPQIGVMKRLVYMYIDSPTVFINPVIDQQSTDMLTLWDDCMCFPDLIVKVKRHRRCRITFLDRGWQEQSMRLEDDLSELLQHECDHLDGVLAVARAIDATSFALRSQKALLS
ncbi:MAG: peptide deformylase [Caldilineaceae bacterium]|nr:peptide deformylase [Caldilineaceae bacterium]